MTYLQINVQIKLNCNLLFNKSIKIINNLETGLKCGKINVGDKMWDGGSMSNFEYLLNIKYIQISVARNRFIRSQCLENLFRM